MRFAIFPVGLIFIVPLLLHFSTAIAENRNANLKQEEDSLAVTFAYSQETYRDSFQKVLMFFDNFNSTLSYVIDKIQHLEDKGVLFEENINDRISKLEQRLEGVQTAQNVIRATTANVMSSTYGTESSTQTTAVSSTFPTDSITERAVVTTSIPSTTEAARLGWSIKTRNFDCWLDVNANGTKPVCASSRVLSWTFNPVGDDFYILRHVTSGKAIGIIPSPDVSYNHYKKLSADYYVSTNTSYHWKVYSTRDGYSRFVNRKTNLALDSDGSIIYHHDINDGQYQHWILDR